MSAVAIDHTETNAAGSPAVWKLGKHIPQLDGVRGFAILIVTLYRFSKELPTDSLAGKFLHTFFSLGDRGVDLFFVLSGFLITGILVDAKGNANYFSHFFVRRSLRIFPLYFGALFLFVIFFQWINPRQFAQANEQQFYLWTYLTNVKMSIENAWCFGYLDHFWSLAVEEHFYLVWPFVLFFCSLRTSWWIACGLAVLSSVSRIGYSILSDNGVAPDVLTIFRCDALLIGAVLALQIRTQDGFRYWKKFVPLLFGSCLLVGLACAVADRRVFTITHTVWPLLWGCVLVWLLTANSGRLLAKFFELSALRQLGKYSYAMYVFQSPLIPLTATVVSASAIGALVGNLVIGHLCYMVAMFGLTYAAAIASWHLLEKHCLKLKQYFPAKQHRPQPGAGRNTTELQPDLKTSLRFNASGGTD